MAKINGNLRYFPILDQFYCGLFLDFYWTRLFTIQSPSDNKEVSIGCENTFYPTGVFLNLRNWTMNTFTIQLLFHCGPKWSIVYLPSTMSTL